MEVGALTIPVEDHDEFVRASRAVRACGVIVVNSAASLAAFDLVSAQYASIPRTPDGRGVANLLNGVAPAGTLPVVSHDLEPMRTAINTTTDSRTFDPDAHLRVEDFAAAFEHLTACDIEVCERRPSPPGTTTTTTTAAAHRVDDVVLRARRRTGVLDHPPGL